MPIYEYMCSNCREITEEWQKFSDPPLISCPKCGGSLRKLISMNAFHLKGNGWYVTDYSSKSKNNGKAKEPKQASTESNTEKKE